VCGYRPGALDAFGLSSDELAERHPGLVAVYLAAWGHTGPWATRRGFDSVVQGPTGIALGESRDGTTPGVLPCQLLDHGTGYLAAAAAVDGLRRQADEGGTHIRRLSLARTAYWLTCAGTTPTSLRDTDHAEQELPILAQFGQGEDRICAVRPPGSIDGHHIQWPGPPARYCSDPPAWQS
jgi:crotonobetainyl-CoA:carnitine CoA-transferase CaiB-like acyl-CoA transferase